MGGGKEHGSFEVCWQRQILSQDKMVTNGCSVMHCPETSGWCHRNYCLLYKVWGIITFGLHTVGSHVPSSMWAGGKYSIGFLSKNLNTKKNIFILFLFFLVAFLRLSWRVCNLSLICPLLDVLFKPQVDECNCLLCNSVHMCTLKNGCYKKQTACCSNEVGVLF